MERVKFGEGEVGGEHYGRIDGYIGKWELVKSIDISSSVNKPLVCGFISDDEIILESGNKALYVTNISTDHTKKVTEGGGNVRVTSCTPVDGNIIVFGKWRRDCTGDSLDGCITLYDRQWKMIRDITIPRKTSNSYFTVYVDVDRDGMILAAQYDQSNIYVINPADGKIVNTVTMQDKKVLGGIQALSSGDIVVQAAGDKFTLMSRSGEEKAVIRCDEWKWPTYCYTDKLTNTLYIRYQDKERIKIYAVDQVSRDGKIQTRRIVEYKQSDSSRYVSPCLVTPSGKLVACDGDKLFVYKNGFL